MCNDPVLLVDQKQVAVLRMVTVKHAVPEFMETDIIENCSDFVLHVVVDRLTDHNGRYALD